MISTPAPDRIITARGLGRTFRSGRRVVEAVVDLDLDVARGELVAFLGPNGAGKSTSLRMLTTLIPPTTGTATVAGRDIRADAAGVRSRIGFIGQGSSGGHNQRVRDELLSQGAFYGMRRADARRRADELLDSLDLAPLATRGVMGLSGGQKRRLDIALGLIHEPELLFLDEPSTGLDPQSRANLWAHIERLRAERGTTVFVTTHYLEEADRYAERVMVMDRGRVIADDTATALKAKLAGDVLRLGFPDQAAADAAAAAVARLASTDPRRERTDLELDVADGERLLPRLLRELDAAGSPVERASVRPPTLDDVFLALTGRSLRDAGDGAGDGEHPDQDGQHATKEQAA
jgi:ABC-2 type transport system ATP-binding protein